MLTLSISGPSEPEEGDRLFSKILAGEEVKPSSSKCLTTCPRQVFRPSYGPAFLSTSESFNAWNNALQTHRRIHSDLCHEKKKYFSVAVIFLRI